MKILIDMNLSPLWVEFLVESGFDSVHWSSIGPSAAPDTQIMDYASANGLVVFTHDLDFGALLASRKTRRPSVIQIRAQDVLPKAIGELVVRALHASGFCRSSRSSGRNPVPLLRILVRPVQHFHHVHHALAAAVQSDARL